MVSELSGDFVENAPVSAGLADGWRRKGLVLGARRVTSWLFLPLLLCGLATDPGVDAAGGPDLASQVKGSVDRACRWLKESQNPDGGYGPYSMRLENASDLGISALVLHALAVSPRQYKAADGPFVSRAVDFILERQQENGAFYDRRDPSLQNYKTSVVVMALVALNATKYAEPIRKAQVFLRAIQLDEDGGYDPEKHLSYGGFGYGSGLRPDLSNTQYALDALVASGVSGSDELFQKAVLYVSRSLNTTEVDVLLDELEIASSGDGGGRYGPNITRGPVQTLDGKSVFSSYGSMSYAALKAFLYARVDKDDPRVAGLWRWIGQNWTVRENPGMATPKNPGAGRHGYYYYLHTLSKALSLYGERRLKDSDGVEHDWVVELSTHLLGVQSAEGFWTNESDRWWENISALDSAYAVIVLSNCLSELKKEP